MPDSISRAARHRERAKECRTIAQAAQQDPQLAKSYEDLADRYEQLARYEEGSAQVYPEMAGKRSAKADVPPGSGMTSVLDVRTPLRTR